MQELLLIRPGPLLLLPSSAAIVGRKDWVGSARVRNRSETECAALRSPKSCGRAAHPLQLQLGSLAGRRECLRRQTWEGSRGTVVVGDTGPAVSRAAAWGPGGDRSMARTV